MEYLLDADWVIEALAGRQRVVEAITRLAPAGIAISLITIGEVYEGAFGFPNPQAHLASFRRFLRPFPVLTLTDPIVERFARIRSDLRRQGRIIPDFDLLLSATALDHDLMVLTFNVRHLGRVPRLRVYQSS